MKKTPQLYFRTLYVKQNTLKLIKTKIRFAHVIGDIVRCLKGGNNMEKQRLATSVVEAKNPSSLRVKFDCGLNDNGKTIEVIYDKFKEQGYKVLPPKLFNCLYYKVPNS